MLGDDDLMICIFGLRNAGLVDQEGAGSTRVSLDQDRG
jgi:hypothetical protein